MRELLEEARDWIKTDKCWNVEKDALLDRINAALAAPEPDAMEILRQVREFSMAVETDDGIDIVWTKQDSEAAALIADYRRVPRAVLAELMGSGAAIMDTERNFTQRAKRETEAQDAILAKYGYHAE